MSLKEGCDRMDDLETIKHQLMRVSTATVQTQLFKRGLRNTFVFGVRPLTPERARFVAEAFTLRYIPAREDLDVLAAFDDPEHPQRRAIEAAPAGSALVIDARGDARAASAGAILCTRLECRGVAALVTDGSVRDSSAIADLEMPVYTAGVSSTTNLVLHHAVEQQVPVGCGGVPVFPGDVLVGDAEGVVVIPRHLAAEVAADAIEQERLESFLLARVRDGAAQPGTYPPNAATLAAYRAHVGSANPDGAPAAR